MSKLKNMFQKPSVSISNGMKLYLKDGSVYEGESFGAHKSAAGEVVFTTGMVGYVESLTDPSFAGQILVFTYPLIGNYGVPSSNFFESSRVQVAGLVVGEYSADFSHHAARESLEAWLKRSGTPAITGVDTRALTKKLREEGVMLGSLAHGAKPTFKDPNKENLVARVSIQRPKLYAAQGKRKARLVLVDCGAKENIVRSLVSRGAEVLRVPWNFDFSKEACDGVVLSNGPGDPTMCTATIRTVQKAIKAGVPILGVCLGNQLLALAAGGSTYKLPFGHRSQNQPCIEERSKRCYITSQNHGFAVSRTLPKGWELWFTNANDGSVEGIRHQSGTWRSVQFHPEATPGPTDTAWIFDEFLRDVKRHA